jgi:DegV family protein with EDD domain
MTVAVFTDSAAALPPDVAAAHGVVVIPMWVTLGGQSFHDGDLGLDELLGRLDEGVTTSGPTPGEVLEAVAANEGDEGAVVLTIARSMSGTYDAAATAARMLGEHVRVVDTGTAAGAQGLVVLAAARQAAAGGTLAEVEAAAQRAAARVHLVATLDSLDRLAKSGRVPGAAAWAGRWLGLHPVFEFRAGHPAPLRPARSRAGALERIVGRIRNEADPTAPLHVASLHALAEDAARELLDAVRAERAVTSAFIASFSAVMVAHTGPGLVGLAWWSEPLAG